MRVANPILSNKKTPWLGNGTTHTTDVTKGGQNGIMANPAEYASNVAHISSNVIPFLLEAPLAFNQYLDKTGGMTAALKAMLERHVKTIEGLDSKLTVEFAEEDLGGGGEKQEDVINVTRARSSVTTTVPEKEGRPFGKIIDHWILELLGDPETKRPRIFSREDAPASLYADDKSMVMLFVKPDASGLKVDDAWIQYNMMPKEGSERTGKRDLASAGEALILTTPWTGITEQGEHVNAIAQVLLSDLTQKNANPNFRPAFITGSELDKAETEGGTFTHSDVADAKTGNRQQVADMADWGTREASFDHAEKS